MRRWISIPSLAITLVITSTVFASVIRDESTSTALLWAGALFVVLTAINVAMTRSKNQSADHRTVVGSPSDRPADRPHRPHRPLRSDSL